MNLTWCGMASLTRYVVCLALDGILLALMRNPDNAFQKRGGRPATQFTR